MLEIKSYMFISLKLRIGKDILLTHNDIGLFIVLMTLVTNRSQLHSRTITKEIERGTTRQMYFHSFFLHSIV